MKKLLVLSLFCLPLFAGCNALTSWLPIGRQTRGEMSASSLTHEKVGIKGNFTTALYAFDDANRVTVVLVEGPLDKPTAAVTMRLFYEPRGGSTPVNANATNTDITYMLFRGNGEVGIYAGAGFVFANDDLGASSVSAGLWQSDLRLKDKTDGFKDDLHQASLVGDFTARRDDVGARDAIRRLGLLVSQRLSYARFVQGHVAADDAMALRAD